MRRILLGSVSIEALFFNVEPGDFPTCLVHSKDAVYVRRLTFMERCNNRTNGELLAVTHGVFFGETGEPLVWRRSYAAALREARELSEMVHVVH